VGAPCRAAAAASRRSHAGPQPGHRRRLAPFPCRAAVASR
jgi:hypothetical protein